MIRKSSKYTRKNLISEPVECGWSIGESQGVRLTTRSFCSLSIFSMSPSAMRIWWYPALKSKIVAPASCSSIRSRGGLVLRRTERQESIQPCHIPRGSEFPILTNLVFSVAVCFVFWHKICSHPLF